MSSTSNRGFRIAAATGLHRGDREYQQDQVDVFMHSRVAGCALALVADGMGGKSGGRLASEQVLMTAGQVFERYAPATDDPVAMLERLVAESHMMIRLTSFTSEAEPHSTIAAVLVLPDKRAFTVHAGDSRCYHFRGAQLQRRTFDHSYVQTLVDEGKLTEMQANAHPQSNLLTGCLGTDADPPIEVHSLGRLRRGDTLLVCSDGLWHYFGTSELGGLVGTASPREASEALVEMARERARGGGDNLSLALIRIEAIA